MSALVVSNQSQLGPYVNPTTMFARYSNDMKTSFTATAVNVIGGSWSNYGTNAYAFYSLGAGWPGGGGGAGWSAAARFTITSNLPSQYALSLMTNTAVGSFTIQLCNTSNTFAYSIIAGALTASGAGVASTITITNFSGATVFTGSALTTSPYTCLGVTYSGTTVAVSICSTTLWTSNIPTIGKNVAVLDYNGNDNYAGSWFTNFLVSWQSPVNLSGIVLFSGDLVPSSPYLYNAGDSNHPLKNVYTGTLNAWNLPATNTPYLVSYTVGTGDFGYTQAGSNTQFIYNTGAGLGGSSSLTTVCGFTVVGSFTPPTFGTVVAYSNSFTVGLNTPTTNTIGGSFTVPSGFGINASYGIVLGDGSYTNGTFTFSSSITTPNVVQVSLHPDGGDQYKAVGLRVFDTTGAYAYSCIYSIVGGGACYLNITNMSGSTVYSSIKGGGFFYTLAITRTSQYITIVEDGVTLYTAAAFNLGPLCDIYFINQGHYGGNMYITNFSVTSLTQFPVTNTLAIGGDVTPLVNNVYNLGAQGYALNTIYAGTGSFGSRVSISGIATFGSNVTVAGTQSNTGIVTFGSNLAVTGTFNVTGATTMTYSGSSPGLTISGTDTVGGAGYMNFLRVTNTSAGVTNPTKTFRLDSAGTFQLINNAYNAPLLTITDGGALTIGNTFLVNANSFYMSSNSSVNTGFGGLTAAGDGGFNLWWGSSGNGGANDRLWRFAWQNDRNVVIYTGATANWSTGTSTSDGRLKTNVIKTSLSCADIVMTTDVIDFEWKADSDLADGGKTHTGFIAQHLEDRVPDAVKTIGGTKLLHKEELVPILWKALQETINRVAVLEAQISNLMSSKYTHAFDA